MSPVELQISLFEHLLNLVIVGFGAVGFAVVLAYLFTGVYRCTDKAKKQMRKTWLY